jgi:FkbM family methyltransferase
MKDVRIANKTYPVAGLSNSDLYFGAITDDFEPDFQEFCRRYIQDDYTCLDIGANIGMKSLMLSQFVPHGRVLAVEAAPTVGNILNLNVENSGERNITVSRCAISDTDGEVSFADNSAYGHITSEGTRVACKRVSTLLAEHGLSRLDFIKIDVEGFEYPILKDALEVINQHRSLVLFEFNSWCQLAYSNVAPLEFANWILESFSHVFMVRPGRPFGEDLQRVRPNEALTLLHTNLIEDRTLTDILVTNAPERLAPSLAYLQQQASEALFERDVLTVRLEEMQVYLVRLASERDALLSSTSWRISKPLRTLKQLLRRKG